MKNYEKLSKFNQLDARIEYKGDGLSVVRSGNHTICIVGCDFGGMFERGYNYEMRKCVEDESQDNRMRKIVKETMHLIISFVLSLERHLLATAISGENHHSAYLAVGRLIVDEEGTLHSELSEFVDEGCLVPNNVDEFILYCEES